MTSLTTQHARHILLSSPNSMRAFASQIEVPEAEEPNADAAAVAKRRGDEAFVAADFQAAVAAYTRALRHDTSSHAVWANRSAAGLRTGDYESALTDARIARTVNPAYTKARAACPS